MTIQQPNSTSDAIALEAIQKALQQLDSSLPDSLQQEINHQLNQVLANPQTEAVENVIKLAKKHEPLYKEYRAIRKNLFNEYQAKPKDKGYVPTNKEAPPATTPNTLLDNAVAPPPTSAEPSPKSQGEINTPTQGQQP
jgi:malate synthase